jgi:glycosyltransferase involved in cell wall biosynthesis
MIVAIDGYEANAGNRVGIGRYAVEILERLYGRIERGDTAFDAARVYLPDKARSHMPGPSSKWKYIVRGPKPLWTFGALPFSLFVDRPRADVIFSPTHYIPRFTSVPSVMAIMDVSYLSYPELFRPQDLHKLVHWTAYSVRHAKAIITISQFSKDAIIKAYKVASDRITVVYPALSESVVHTHSMANTVIQKDFPKRYILSVGTLQPRKNYVRLIEAFSAISDTEVSLCIVGKKGWLYDDILLAPKKYGVADRVRFLDFVPDHDLPALYKNAELFALPSLYEGFGLPVLEAMVHGVPVVVSNTSSLPEIAQEAGIYVDPSDTGSITKGLEQALKEKDTKAEKTRIALGKELTKRFSWDRAADQVLDVLTNVAKGGIT